MRYLSVCSGIEAATVAWHQLGWTPVAFSEIEKFPSAVLAHHYSHTPNLGDMTQHEHWPIGPGSIDLLVGGTPCQSFSVAGLRKGLADPRGNLALTYLAIADRLRPKWLVWENVPGVLSSSGGRDFGSFLGALAELGYGFAYRVLDAQWFGVAQRRRRVFVVGHLGDLRRAAAVLFERESLRGDPAPSREAREAVASDAQAGARAGSWWDGTDCASTLTKEGAGGNQRMPDKDNFGAVLSPVGYRWQNDREGLVEDGTAPACRASTGSSGFHEMNHPVVVQQASSYARDNAAHAAVAVFQQSSMTGKGTIGYETSGIAKPVKTQVDGQMLHHGMAVRRLTPVECERLQGFPDGYTAISWRGKPASECPDGPRYRALGNSMAVPCMRWIGERIAQVDALDGR